MTTHLDRLLLIPSRLGAGKGTRIAFATLAALTLTPYAYVRLRWDHHKGATKDGAIAIWSTWLLTKTKLVMTGTHLEALR